MSKPALLSAFLCPGMGHWVAGWRFTGMILVTLTVLSVMTPFGLFIWGVFTRPFCLDTFWTCTKSMFGHAWHLTWPALLVGVPTLAIVYFGALAHAMTLELPGDGSESPTQSTG